jgi:hypothetical protein
MPEIFEYLLVPSLIPGLFVISPIRFQLSNCFSVKYGLQFSAGSKKLSCSPVKARQSKRFIQKSTKKRLKALRKHSASLLFLIFQQRFHSFPNLNLVL